MKQPSFVDGSCCPCLCVKVNEKVSQALMNF
jgi:hypothetical protein